jgi:hypothetical protein
MTMVKARLLVTLLPWVMRIEGISTSRVTWAPNEIQDARPIAAVRRIEVRVVSSESGTRCRVDSGMSASVR